GLAHPGRHRNARRCAVGARLADFRRPGIPQYRRHAGGHRRHRADRAYPGEARVPAARSVHRRALGHVDVMTTERTKSLWRGALTVVAALAIYQAVARSGHFAPALMPPLCVVAATLAESLLDGSMVVHAAATLYRVLCGFGLAIFVGLPLGVL